jgi:hypothetical protein
MANISYNVILPQNLTLKRLPMKQIEVILDITGAQADPLTLQQIRDEDSLKQCFLARRKNINDLMQATDGRLAKIKSDNEGEAIVNEFNKKLESEINNLQKELQARANNFVQQQRKNVNDLTWAQTKLVVRIVWAFAKFVKGAAEIKVKVTAAIAAGLTGAGVFLSVIALKSIYNSVKDCNAALDELDSAMEDERSQYIKLRDAIKELKKFKKPDKVPQSKIDAVSNLMGPYGARLLGVDTAAKKTATKLDHLLKELDKGKFRNKSAQEEMEKKVDALIQKIIRRCNNVAEGRKLLQGARDKVNETSKRAQKDPGSFWLTSENLWKTFDFLLDSGEAAMESPAFKAVQDTLLSKIQDEMKDAMMDEQTKV